MPIIGKSWGSYNNITPTSKYTMTQKKSVIILPHASGCKHVTRRKSTRPAGQNRPNWRQTIGLEIGVCQHSSHRNNYFSLSKFRFHNTANLSHQYNNSECRPNFSSQLIGRKSVVQVRWWHVTGDNTHNTDNKA